MEEDHVSIEIEEPSLGAQFDYEQDDDIDDYDYDYDYEDEEVDDDDDDDDDDDEDEEVEEMKLPTVSSWIDSDGTTMQGVELINNGSMDFNNDRDVKNRCGFDDCSICFQSWTSHGKHRICCLPCGHIYGMSCIKKWLRQRQSSQKCPQCNAFCTVKDVRLLYATGICRAHHKEASTTRFPFTKKGFKAFEMYVSQRRDDALRRGDDASRRENDVWGQLIRVSNQLAYLTKQRYDAVTRRNYAMDQLESVALEQRDALERLANASQWRADALERRLCALEPRCDSLERRVDALEQRIDALGRLGDAYNASLAFFEQKYEYIYQRGTKTTQTPTISI